MIDAVQVSMDFVAARLLDGALVSRVDEDRYPFTLERLLLLDGSQAGQ
jgi:hypothetical protein